MIAPLVTLLAVPQMVLYSNVRGTPDLLCLAGASEVIVVGSLLNPVNAPKGMRFELKVERTLKGIGPAVIEHVFALRMGLRIAGGNAHDLATCGLRDQVHGLPAGPIPDRSRAFERG